MVGPSVRFVFHVKTAPARLLLEETVLRAPLQRSCTGSTSPGQRGGAGRASDAFPLRPCRAEVMR